MMFWCLKNNSNANCFPFAVWSQLFCFCYAFFIITVVTTIDRLINKEDLRKTLFANFLEILHFSEKFFLHNLTCPVLTLSGKFLVYIMLFTLENTNNVVFLKSFLLMSPSYDVTIY